MAERRLKDWLNGYLRYTDNSEPPLLYRKWVGISVIAAALQRRCWAEWESRIYPNQYVVLVGPSGGARKGTAMAPGLNLLTNEPTVKLSAESTTREALIRKMKTIGSVEPQEDGTIIRHSSITVFAPELTVFIGYKNEQFLTDLTDWYDCRDQWTYETKGQGVDELIGVCVNLIGATTSEALQHALPNISIGGGLTSRIIFVYADNKEKIIPYPFKSPEEMALLEDLQYDLNVITQMSGPFVYTPEYLKKKEHWYIEQHNKPPMLDPKFWGYLERRATHLLKLSMIMSASRNNARIITADDFDRALAWLRDAEKRMERVYRGYGRKEYAPLIPQVLRMITTHGSVKFTDLLIGTFKDLDTVELRSIIRTFEMQGLVTMTPTENGKDYILTRTDKEG